MKHITLRSKLSLLVLSAILVVPGCSQSLVKDDTRSSSDGTSHCSGSEWADDSTLAVLPIPVVAFFMPHTDLNDIKADDYLKRCGDSSKLINRKVDVGRGTWGVRPYRADQDTDTGDMAMVSCHCFLGS